MIKDCHGEPLPVYARGVVSECIPLVGAIPFGSVYSLKVLLSAGAKFGADGGLQGGEPAAGQFYMLHALRSDVLLGRPISVYHSCTLTAEKSRELYGSEKYAGAIELTFLILLKGKGTRELCSLDFGDLVNLIGPCGNRFPLPISVSENAGGAGACSGKKVCIVGGGIGVAPVAGFAETLPAGSYDFFASFKSGSYGLENLKADKLVITTDDGSVGVHGMLPAALDVEVLKAGNYEAVYACGPTPMLAYVQKICKEAGIKCWLSMEARMACGVGVCLGCVIDTSEGKKRCCKDGPIFDGAILEFKQVTEVAGVKVQPRREPLAANEEPDLSVNIAGVKLANPVIGSSGTFGFGTEYKSLFDVNRLGGISSKGLTLEPRQGNDGIRLHETPSGLMNSIGLQNPGIPHFIEYELPEMLALKPVAIANLSGSSLETYVEGAKLLDKTEVPIIELNISCPNVSAGGAAFGMTCVGAESAVRAVRAVTKKPLIVKLTPQSQELVPVALACIEAGADGISLCNSFQGIAIDIERGIPVFDKLKAGFGGPAVRPIAVRLVYEVVEAINKLPSEKRVPVIAIGGIATWEDAVEFIMAGASAIQVGTNTFANPYTMIEVIDGLAAFMKRKGYQNIEQMRGLIQKK
ncbi:MAG: dihydroorotate dehydrogenase [Treponema sp.]|nr:dihydroorotate dehydrogenase [Treponema sp.]